METNRIAYNANDIFQGKLDDHLAVVNVITMIGPMTDVTQCVTISDN